MGVTLLRKEDIALRSDGLSKPTFKTKTSAFSGRKDSLCGTRLPAFIIPAIITIAII